MRPLQSRGVPGMTGSVVTEALSLARSLAHRPRLDECCPIHRLIPLQSGSQLLLCSPLAFVLLERAKRAHHPDQWRCLRKPMVTVLFGNYCSLVLNAWLAETHMFIWIPLNTMVRVGKPCTPCRYYCPCIEGVISLLH